MEREFLQLSTSGCLMPTIGFGTWQTNGKQLEDALNLALEAGYRHIDTASAYENEETIGKVLKAWISAGKIKREELFLVTKLPPVAVRPNSVQKYLKDSLAKLQVNYIDLYLIHTPFAFQEGTDLHPQSDDGSILLDNTTDHLAVWKILEKEVIKGTIKSIGLSNFNIQQIEKIYNGAKIKPDNLQIEMHIHLQQKKLVSYCRTKGITVTGYSPLGSTRSSEIFAVCNPAKYFGANLIMVLLSVCLALMILSR